MGIKGAKSLLRASLLSLSLLLVGPAFAQDADDAPSSDPEPDVDRSLSDRTRSSERDDGDIDRPAVLPATRDEKKSTIKVRPGLRARLLDVDSELDADNDEDRGDNIDRDGVEDEDKPKKKPEAPKKEPPKKDAPKKDAPASAKKVGDCVEVKGEARFSGVGYDHLVTLKSTCKKRMKCSVRTNVNAEPASVALDPGAEETVLTWRGSPAREFTPDVKCD